MVDEKIVGTPDRAAVTTALRAEVGRDGLANRGSLSGAGGRSLAVSTSLRRRAPLVVGIVLGSNVLPAFVIAVYAVLLSEIVRTLEEAH